MGFISWLYKTQNLGTHILIIFLSPSPPPSPSKITPRYVGWSFTISQNPNVAIWYVEDFQVCQQKVVPACAHGGTKNN